MELYFLGVLFLAFLTSGVLASIVVSPYNVGMLLLLIVPFLRSFFRWHAIYQEGDADYPPIETFGYGVFHWLSWLFAPFGFCFLILWSLEGINNFLQMFHGFGGFNWGFVINPSAEGIDRYLVHGTIRGDIQIFVFPSLIAGFMLIYSYVRVFSIQPFFSSPIKITYLSMLYLWMDGPNGELQSPVPVDSIVHTDPLSIRVIGNEFLNQLSDRTMVRMSNSKYKIIRDTGLVHLRLRNKPKTAYNVPPVISRIALQL